MAKTIDCFPFFNELEILEIRLNELSEVVDQFVLVEGTRTHQKKKKPLYFEKNKDLFKPFLDRITHLVVESWPGFFHKFRSPNPFDYDNYQKEYAIRALKGLPKDTNVIFSDVDEIPRASEVARHKDSKEIKIFEQRLYNYWLNNICVFYDTHGKELPAQKNKNGLGFWRGSVMLPLWRIKTLKQTRLYRDLQSGPITIIEEGGWHFSYIGDVERVKKKLDAYAHSEYNVSMKELEKLMKSGTNVIPDEETKFELEEINESYPNYLRDHQEKYAHLIGKPVAE
jgi:beta-1,4-mannosyl-glycoprotein beta-1,4-N-acetylglucosaminyltransferase